MQYLLSTHAFLELALRPSAGVLATWIDQQNLAPEDVSISVVTVGQAKLAALNASNDARAAVLRRRIDEQLRLFERLKVVRPFEDICIRHWVTLLRVPLMWDERGAQPAADIGEGARMIIATAMTYDLTLVTSDAPWVGEARKLGLQVFDPFA